MNSIATQALGAARVLFFTFTGFGCNDLAHGGHGHGADVGDPGAEGHGETGGGHGTETSLGSLEVAGRRFEVLLLGELIAGKMGAMEVVPVGAGAGDDSVFLWLEGADGARLSAPAKGANAGDRLHFHVTPSAEGGAPRRVVLRVRGEGVDERGALALPG